MCGFWKGSFIEYATALSPYIIVIFGFIVAKITGILKYYKIKTKHLLEIHGQILLQMQREAYIAQMKMIVFIHLIQRHGKRLRKTL